MHKFGSKKDCVNICEVCARAQIGNLQWTLGGWSRLLTAYVHSLALVRRRRVQILAATKEILGLDRDNYAMYSFSVSIVSPVACSLT